MAVLTIAGSDPDGGAGIQADLKTFQAFGLAGTSAITCVTAQNTKKLLNTFYLPENIIKDQLDAIFSDFKVEAVKIGLLGKKEIVETVAEELKRHRAKNIVLDPIITTQADRKLLIEKDSLTPLVQMLFPLSTLITPNTDEAGIIAGISISDLSTAEQAAKTLISLGAKNIIVKGIKTGDKIHDLFYSRNKKKIFTKSLIQGGTHGGGCVFSSAIAANLALGKNILESVEIAEEFINNSILSKKKLGKGIEVVDPLAQLYKDSGRYSVLKAVKNALDIIES
ncbi:MAG: bifunctional hydroxymethylpyrimidine kinase/phosphomethylpyrimidine kinase, partial [Planctomycetes bacterium]|nr:bifunctional hydroxymethylpyrimidine kinase/phosphomethylpyrimidine kinase [Planctomycetota bacterium]